MNDKAKQEEVVLCPLGRFFSDLEKLTGRKAKFFEHLKQSQVEFLKAIRSLVDERIEDLEKKKPSHEGKKRATKIKVE